MIRSRLLKHRILPLQLMLFVGCAAPHLLAADDDRPPFTAQTIDRARVLSAGNLANYESFPRYTCRMQIVAGTSGSIEEAIARGVVNERARAEVRMAVDGPRTTYVRTSTSRPVPSPGNPHQGTLELGSVAYLSHEGLRMRADLVFGMGNISEPGPIVPYEHATWNLYGMMGEGEEGLMSRYMAGYFSIAEESLRVAPEPELRRGTEVTRIVCGHGDFPQINFYVDESRGFIPVEIVTNVKGNIRRSFTTDIQACSDGRWFPMRCVFVLVTEARDASQLPVWEIKVTDLEVDKPPPVEAFRVELPKGMRLSGWKNIGWAYELAEPMMVDPGDLDDLMERVDRKAAGLPVGPPPVSKNLTIWVVAGSLVVIAVMASLMLWRRSGQAPGTT